VSSAPTIPIPAAPPRAAVATPTEEPKPQPRRRHRYERLGWIPFLLSHLVMLGAFWSGVTWQAVVVCAVLYWGRMLAVTGAYHRYFSHRTYETSRAFQFVLGLWAASTIQRGPLWWAAHHRGHHLHSDTERDLHSPVVDGFWHSHFMWLFAGNADTDWKRVKDFTKYPELVWLDKYWLVVPVVLSFVVWALWGWPGLFIGFALSTVLGWHTTFLVNSLAHVWGRRRFETSDDSRNNWVIALLTLGEGWHNNHHRYMNSARQGFYWWEVDVTYYFLRALQAVGLIWNLKEPPQRILDEGRARDAQRAS
jgi:stearoyl-CoA desaturase (Delta-9 desaturase)